MGRILVLETEGLGPIQKLRWADLTAGMIYVGGIRLNDIVPPELRDYPVLTTGLLGRLQDTYRLRPEREIFVIPVHPGHDPRAAAQKLRAAAAGLDHLNRLRGAYETQKRLVLRRLGLDPDTSLPMLGSIAVDHESLILDVYNSFTVPIRASHAPLPSFLGRAGVKLTIGDLLTGRLREKIRLPADSDVLLHLVVDYSFSMRARGKDEIVAGVLELFHRHVQVFLPRTRIRLYVFSDTCRSVDFPLSGREVGRRGTSFSAFIKRVLHHRDPERRNTVLVFTDGMPSDQPEALRLAELFRKNRIDYTQLVFGLNDDLRFVAQGVPPGEVLDGFTEERPGLDARELTDQELARKKHEIRRGFTALAGAAGGNQVILSIDEVARLVAVECYDRYLGLLTLATAPEVEAVEASRPAAPSEPAGPPLTPAPPGPAVRKAVFPRVERKTK